MSPALKVLLDRAAVRTLEASAVLVDEGEPSGLVDRHERLAALEVLLSCADGLLGDLGEHRFLNQRVTRERAASWLSSAQRWAEECKALWNAGADADALLVDFNHGRALPVGTRDWLDGVVRGLRWCSRPEWLERVFSAPVPTDEEE